MRIFTITYHIDYWSGWLSCRGRDLTPVYDNFRDYGHHVKQRKPFNQRVVKGKSRESKKTFHSNEIRSDLDRLAELDDLVSMKINEEECYSARFIKYKQNPRNRAKARWSKGGDLFTERQCKYAMQPSFRRYDEELSFHTQRYSGPRRDRVWWRDAHSHAYLKYSLCTKGVDGITGWCDFGGKWMKRKLSKHERRNGKNQLRKDIEDLFLDEIKKIDIVKS